jgi:hypothetical protein
MVGLILGLILLSFHDYAKRRRGQFPICIMQ